MRLGARTLVFLGLCAAAVAAATAHVVIDIVGDYALPRDTYDGIGHSSRELVTGVALLIAALLLGRGLRICFEIAAANRRRIRHAVSLAGERASFLCGVIAVAATAVPAMEWLDGRLDGVPVKELDDAFGGSILLGLGTTVVCSALVAAFIYAVARWLVSHRDDVAAIIGTLLTRGAQTLRPSAHELVRHLLSPRRRRTEHALRLCKRGPPGGALAMRHCQSPSTEGDTREIRSRSRGTSVCRARRRAWIRCARLRAAHPAPADCAAR